MKKYLSIIFSAAIALGCLCSCSSEADSSSQSIEFPSIDEENVLYGAEIPLEAHRYNQLLNSENYYDYMKVCDNSWFGNMMINFTDSSNPLQLTAGTDKNSYAVKPYKVAIVDDEKYLGLSNFWNFPVVSEEKGCLGMITVDCRNGEPDAYSFSASKGIAENLNQQISKGKLAVFSIGKPYEIYGIFENNEVVVLSGREKYYGSLTYKDIAHEYNVITQEHLNEIIYP